MSASGSGPCATTHSTPLAPRRPLWDHGARIRTLPTPTKRVDPSEVDRRLVTVHPGYGERDGLAGLGVEAALAEGLAEAQVGLERGR